MIHKLQAEAASRQQKYGDDDGYRGGGGRGGNRGGDNRDNRRDDRRDGEKVYMKKQNSVQSNASEQGRGGNRNRRNTQGKGGNDAQSKGQAQNKPEPIKITEEQLSTRLQVLFNKFVKQQTPSEEEKQDDQIFQTVKDLVTAGVLEGKDKQIRLDDIFSSLLSKLIDMPTQTVEANIEAFFKAMMESRCAAQQSWKFAVRRCLCEIENYIGDLLNLP